MSRSAAVVTLVTALLASAAACTGAGAPDPTPVEPAAAASGALVDPPGSPGDDLDDPPPQGTMNGTMNASLNGTMNSTLNGTMNGALNGTMNGTMNAALNAAIVASLNSDLDDPLDPDLDDVPEGTMNGTIDASLLATLTTTLAGQVLVGETGDLADDLSAYTLAEVDQRCATTEIEGPGSDGANYRVRVPRLTILLGDFADTLVTVVSEGVSYRVLTTYAIACEDRAVRVLLLSPTPAGPTVRTYEDDVTHMCARFRDPVDNQRKWFCGTGTLGAGTPVYAQPATMPTWGPQRVAFPRELEFGGNRFAFHFAWSTTLAPISRPIPDADQNGYATPTAWGLNPNQHWPDGSSKAPDYVAAVAVKATTGRNGVRINPYVRNVAGPVDPSSLNDCETGGAGDQYLASPDIASTGELRGIFVDLSASPGFIERCPAWVAQYGIPQAELADRHLPDRNVQCKSFAVERAVARPRLGLNVVDSDSNRHWCPAGLARFGQDGNGSPNKLLAIPSVTAQGEKNLAVVPYGPALKPRLVALGQGKICVAQGACSPVLGTLTSLVAAGPDLVATSGWTTANTRRMGQVWIFRLVPDATAGVGLQAVTRIPMPSVAGSPLETYLPVGIASANVDVDQNLELVVTASEQNAALLLDQRALGWSTRVLTIVGEHPRVVQAADVDRDGFDEVLVGCDTVVSVLTRDAATSSLRSMAKVLVGMPVLGLGAGDLDTDGHVDLVVATSTGVRSFLGQVGIAGLRWVPGRDVSSHPATDLVVTDLNQDGHVDVAANAGGAVVNFAPGRSQIDIYFGWGDGYFQESYVGTGRTLEYLGLVAYPGALGLPDLAAIRLFTSTLSLPPAPQFGTGFVDVFENHSR